MSNDLSFGMGEDIGSYVSWGFDYVAVVIPLIITPTRYHRIVGGISPKYKKPEYQKSELIKPEIIFLPKKYKFTIELLKILSQEMKQQLSLNKLSIVKLVKIKRLCKELNITLPIELELLINDLEIINKDTKNVDLNFSVIEKVELKRQIDLNKLSVVNGLKETIELTELKMLAEHSEIFIISRLSLIKQIKQAIETSSLNINVKKKTELLELLDTINE